MSNEICYPNAKLNLGLNILSKRSDGYHELESLFIPYYGIKDVLEVVRPAKDSDAGMYLYGIRYDGAPEDNLCWKAYELLAEKYDIPPLAIHLYKQIPVGAGLGGGSADAAFTLKTIPRMCGLGLSEEVLAAYSAKLGSDCPFFIFNRPMIARGRGEILTPYDIDLSAWRIELATPPVSVSTREAYAGISPHEPEVPLQDALQMDIAEWHTALKNDFEPSVFAAHPEIAAIKKEFYQQGAVYASMSGSGSSVFALFPK